MLFPRALALVPLLALASGLSCARAQGGHGDAARLAQAQAALTDASGAADVRGGNAFSLRLYQALAKQPGNLFVSPLSVRVALAMAAGGAQGKTLAEMAAALGLEGEGDAPHAALGALLSDLAAASGPGHELVLANRLWGQQGYGFLPAFLGLADTFYGGGFSPADFKRQAEQERTRINAWVAEQTRTRIQELLPRGSLDDQTRLVLTNAVWFKGEWQTRF